VTSTALVPIRLVGACPAGSESTTGETATPAGASVNTHVRKTAVPAGVRPTASDALKSSLVPLWNAVAKDTVLVVTSTAP
jgi:hypothetical protein